MAQLFTNNAYSTLASGIDDDDTSLTIATGEGARFPSPSGGDYFLATLTQAGTESTWELVKVTARSSDTFTIVRAQEGTSAASWSSGAKVELRISAGALQRFENKTAGVIAATGGSFTADAADHGATYLLNTSGGGTVTLPDPAANPGLSYSFAVLAPGVWALYDGSNNVIRLEPPESCRIISDGTAYRVIEGRLLHNGRSRWRLPVVGHTDDDEFASESLSGSWTQANSGLTPGLDHNDQYSHMAVEWAGGGTGETTFTKSVTLTPGGSFAYAAGFRLQANNWGNQVGIGILTSDEQDGVAGFIGRDSGGSHTIAFYTLDSGSWNQVQSYDMGANNHDLTSVVLYLQSNSDFWLLSWSQDVVYGSAALSNLGNFATKDIDPAKLRLYFNYHDNGGGDPIVGAVQSVDFVRRIV